MKHSTPLRRALLGAAAVLMFQHGVAAQAQYDGDQPALRAPRVPMAAGRPSPGGLAPSPAADEQASADATQGDVATLMQLIHDGQLVELRTTYNGSYGASLFFYPPDLTWYVALFQDKHFWRVIRSQDDGRAEAIYADFVRQTEQLADVEIRRTQLEAQKAYLDRVIALSQDRARRLQADLDVARTQQARVDDRQRQAQADAMALRAEQVQARARLRDLERQVRELQRETEEGLPGAPK